MSSSLSLVTCLPDGRNGTPGARSHTTGITTRSAGGFIYDVSAADSGDGHDINAVEVARSTAAFTPPVHDGGSNQ
jgi:hypothetical protein